MAQTFDIRFGRAAGNSLGWSGGGLLSIDAQGMSIALKLSLLSLLVRRRSQRISAESIKEVYREGDALRVDFATAENARATVPFRARDRETAAQIVQLMPTSRTIEVEHGSSSEHGTPGWKPVALWGAAVVALIAASAALVINFKRPAVNAQIPRSVAAATGAAEAAAVSSIPPPPEIPDPAARANSKVTAAPLPSSSMGEPITPEQARRLAIMAEDPVDWTVAPPTAEPEAEAFVPMAVPEIRPRADYGVVPVPQTTLAYGSARALLQAFEAEAADLSGGYRRERERLDKGDLDTQTFAARLDGFELRWRNLIERVLQDKQFSAPDLTGLRATLLSVVISQRVFLSGYAAGLRNKDQPRIERAFEELARAEEQLARARQYVN